MGALLWDTARPDDSKMKFYSSWERCLVEVSIVNRLKYHRNASFVFMPCASFGGGATAYVFPPFCAPLVSLATSEEWKTTRQGVSMERKVEATLSQVTDALTCMHELGFAHLSVGKDSVRFEPGVGVVPRVRLFDFEFCRPLGDVVGETDVARGAIAPDFSCPELVRGDRFVAATADPWSLGVLAFLLATSSSLFSPWHTREAHDEFLRASKKRAVSRMLTERDAGPVLPSWPWLHELLDRTLLEEAGSRVPFV